MKKKLAYMVLILLIGLTLAILCIEMYENPMKVAVTIITAIGVNVSLVWAIKQI